MINNNAYLEALLQGDTKVIQTFYINFFPKVKNFILQNNGQHQDAEDVFQLALLQLATRYKKERFEIKSTFEGYLFTVCKNLWRRELNKSKNRVTSHNTIKLVSEEQDMALALVEQKKWEIFEEALKQISENCQAILKLFFSKTPYSKMMKIMQYNSETVARQRVFKCKAKLKEIIKKNKYYKSLI